jgi:hypothetical protein
MIPRTDFLFDRPGNQGRCSDASPVSLGRPDRYSCSRPLTPFGLITLEPLGYLGSPRCRMSVNSPLVCLFRIRHHRTQSFCHSACSVLGRFLAQDLTAAYVLGCSRDRQGRIKTHAHLYKHRRGGSDFQFPYCNERYTTQSNYRTQTFPSACPYARCAACRQCQAPLQKHHRACLAFSDRLLKLKRSASLGTT